MAIRRHLAAVVAVVAATACSSLPTARPGSPFAGTAWQLHAIQSMDDAQGTTRVSDPNRFTLRFETEGRASLRLDCNRGTGTWKAKPAGGDSGALTFGPIAATRALCPPPHLDERIVRDLAYVRSYLLNDGKLFMSLMADGGIYEWHPHR
jgi:heat shock protein HslJ